MNRAALSTMDYALRLAEFREAIQDARLPEGVTMHNAWVPCAMLILNAGGVAPAPGSDAYHELRFAAGSLISRCAARPYDLNVDTAPYVAGNRAGAAYLEALGRVDPNAARVVRVMHLAP